MTFAQRRPGGSAVYARSLLAALKRREDVDVHEISGPRRSDFVGTVRWLQRGARSALLEESVDLLHCPSFVVPWRVPVPFAVTVHDAGARLFPGDHPLEWRVYDRAFLANRLKEARRVFTGSNFSRKEIITVYGLDPDRVVTVHYGVDPRYLEPQAEEPGLENAPMLAPGAPVRRKNVQSVLRCMAEARPGSALARVELNISGASPESFPELTRLIESSGLSGRVHWLGVLPADRLPSLMARSSVVVYPSLSEGFGFPVLEALAVGTPVVCSNRGSLPEVVGEAGLVVDPLDLRAMSEALEAVLTRPELRRSLRQAGRTRVREFTWERCADDTVSAYRDVIGETVRNH